MTEENLTPQSLKQKKILLAGSEHAPVIIELMKDCITKNKIIGKTEWDTIVNALTLEIQGDMIQSMVAYIEAIRKGALTEE